MRHLISSASNPAAGLWGSSPYYPGRRLDLGIVRPAGRLCLSVRSAGSKPTPIHWTFHRKLFIESAAEAAMVTDAFIRAMREEGEAAERACGR
jgi:hypothetical protein